MPLPQRFTHRRAGVRFRDGIEVAVDVGGSEYRYVRAIPGSASDYASSEVVRSVR